MLFEFINRLSFVLALTVTLSMQVQANTPTKESVRVAVGLAKPPFIMDDYKSGIQLDIFREAFAQLGYQVEFVFVPLGRNLTALNELELDGVALLPPNFPTDNLTISKPYITYQNVAVALKAKHYQLESVKDLAGKSVVAFQNARKYLGHDYRLASEKTSHYLEVAEQVRQVKMLFKERTDLIILDRSIFAYLAKNLPESDDKTVEIFPVFSSKTLYSAAFIDPELTTIFESGLQRLINKGRYADIYYHYTGERLANVEHH